MDRPLEVVSLVRSAALDGVILAPPASDHPEILDGLLNAHIPFARIAPQSRLAVGLSTAMDDVAAARAIAEHVVGLGPRTIAIIMGDTAPAARAQPPVGFRPAFDAIWLSPRPPLV